MPIYNAKDIPLGQSYGGLPDVSGAMLNWFQNMTFIQIVKTVVNFQVVETPTKIDFQGVWQPFSPKQLALLPEGQRAWSWFMCHADPNLKLDTDEIIKYEGQNYRVMANNDYTHYGYREYHLVQDYRDGLLIADNGDNLTTESGGDFGT